MSALYYTDKSIGDCDGSLRTTYFLTEEQFNGGNQCSGPASTYTRCAHCGITSTDYGSCNGYERTITYFSSTAYNGGSACSTPSSVVEHCNLSSDCGVVISLWKDFGKSLDPQYLSKDKTSCCTMEGVTCSGEKVIEM